MELCKQTEIQDFRLFSHQESAIQGASAVLASLTSKIFTPQKMTQNDMNKPHSFRVIFGDEIF